MYRKLVVAIILFLLVWISGLVFAVEDEWYESDGTKSVESVRDGKTLNGIFPFEDQSGFANFWIVGDSGLVVRYKGDISGTYPIPLKLDDVQGSEQILNSTHNLMSVSFAGRDTGWIVGYVNGGDSIWKGVIWKTTNGGDNWSRFSDNNLPQLPILTPFLKVQLINSQKIWISCGNGYVLRTVNGGQTWDIKKPAGESNFNWFYGLYAFDENNAFVAGDQTGLVARKLATNTDWELIRDTSRISYQSLWGLPEWWT
jgi:photosystem II stability/assembly factor-like uncharacterized protein